jgi:hypothetical protein
MEMANFQAAISINPAFVNGGAITATLVGGSSDLNAAQIPTSIGYDAALNCIKIAPKSPPRTLNPGTSTSSTNGTLISTTGTKVCRINLSNSVDFSNTTLNPIWNFTIQPYRTVVTAFVGTPTAKVNTLITLAESHSKTLNLAVLTEGNFDSGTELLRKAQDADADFNTWDKFSGLTADTVTVQLAEVDSPWNILYTVHGVNLNTNGNCRVSVPGNFTGNYYIIVNHRNCVETWSKAGGESFSGNTVSYDLTSSASQAFGSNLKQVSDTKYALFAGDVSSATDVKDGYIDFFDLQNVYNLNVLSSFGYQNADVTGDGFVDFFDLQIVYNNNVNSIGMNTPPNPAKKHKL